MDIDDWFFIGLLMVSAIVAFFLIGNLNKASKLCSERGGVYTRDGNCFKVEGLIKIP